MRVLASYAEAEMAVQTITTIMKETGKIPEVLLQSYRETLKYSYKGVVQKFYSELAKKCPEALKYFQDV
ncbi:MAG: hypothetical protein GX452_13840 [Ignavibacteriales bacterium]|nr:hypothetical protein [Ignavibacteriales bacterium]